MDVMVTNLPKNVDLNKDDIATVVKEFIRLKDWNDYKQQGFFKSLTKKPEGTPPEK